MPFSVEVCYFCFGRGTKQKGVMRVKGKRYLLTGTGLLLSFGLWTILVLRVDVQPLGQNGTDIGLATVNLWFHRLTGVHMTIYMLTDWLGLVPIMVCLFFGGLGAVQLIKSKSLRRVDPDLILLGIYYVLVIFLYLLFETIPINYRPIPINGMIETSYPSSTVLLVLSVMPTLSFQIDRRSANANVRKAASAFAAAFSGFTVAGRAVAGVHWLSDIVGAILLCAGLFMLYCAAVFVTDKRR